MSENNKKNQASITRNETILGEMTEEEIEKASKKILFEKGESLNGIRKEKRYRETHSTFAAYANKEYGVTREHGQNMAKVAAFREVTNKFMKDVPMSFRSVDQFVKNQNKRARAWHMTKVGLSNFTPLLEQVIGITIDTVKNDKGKITEKVINVSDGVITDFLDAQNLEYDNNLIKKATAKLAENRERLVAKCKARLMEKVIPKTIETCKHIQEIVSIENDFLTLKCGCVFRSSNV